jgi:cyclic-di-AMP phosphodiesterase
MEYEVIQIAIAKASIFLFQSSALIGLFSTLLCLLLMIAFPLRTFAKEAKEQDIEESTLSVRLTQIPYPCGFYDKKMGLYVFNQAMDHLFKESGLSAYDLEQELKGHDLCERSRSVPGEIVRIGKNESLFALVQDSTEEGLCYVFSGGIASDGKNAVNALILFYIDNFDEVLRSTEVKNRPSFAAEIDSIIYQWCSENEIFVKKIGEEKFVGLISNCKLSICQTDQFPVLDRVRSISQGNRVQPTLSIGISIGDVSALKMGENAESALEIAVSRGGDQVVVKQNDGFRFYGGRLNLNRRRSSIKARMVANQLNEALEIADQIIIMGHKAPDLDSLGAAVGVSALARRMNKKVRIVLEEDDPWITRLSARLIPEAKIHELFISAIEAEKIVGHDILLIVVDTNRPELVLAPRLLETSNRLIVIDHHRRVGATIEGAEILYVDPYASSTTELVVEFFQYEKDAVVLDEWEATLMLAGIALDTKNFTVFTGAETFDAAAYLRREGADPLLVRDMMRDDLSTFILRAEIMHNIEIYREDIALGYCSEVITNAAELAAQTADQMLNIRGVRASFVLCKYPDGIWVSARSLGSVNVQNILEKLGGGGHTMGAGAQLHDVDINEAKGKLIEAIDEYSTGRG